MEIIAWMIAAAILIPIWLPLVIVLMVCLTVPFYIVGGLIIGIYKELKNELRG